MANVHPIDTYTSTFTDSYFFDANVLIYLHCPIGGGNKREQRLYSNFYKQALQQRRGIFINSMVLSEFANAYLRIDFNLWKKETKNYGADYKRNFVGTQRFRATVSDIKVALDTILQTSERMTDNFNAINLSSVLSEFGLCDFNDAYYIELARMNGWKIVTHDADLFKSNSLGVDIITANI